MFVFANDAPIISLPIIENPNLFCPCYYQGKVEAPLRDYVEEKGMVQISDPEVIGQWIDQVLEANPEQLEQFRGGKTKLQGYFVGCVCAPCFRCAFRSPTDRYTCSSYGKSHATSILYSHIHTTNLG